MQGSPWFWETTKPSLFCSIFVCEVRVFLEPCFSLTTFALKLYSQVPNLLRFILGFCSCHSLRLFLSLLKLCILPGSAERSSWAPTELCLYLPLALVLFCLVGSSRVWVFGRRWSLIWKYYKSYILLEISSKNAFSVKGIRGHKFGGWLEYSFSSLPCFFSWNPLRWWQWYSARLGEA